MNRRACLLVVAALLASGCGASQHHGGPPKPTHPWTSSAEPSPPGSGGRWSPADEEQLREAEGYTAGSSTSAPSSGGAP
jgi:hypothetical protein